jgi:predicted patatin/cPLA2 family phospholipase
MKEIWFKKYEMYILLRYITETKWYRLYNLVTNKIILNKDIICDERKRLLDIMGTGNNMNNDEYQKIFMFNLKRDNNWLFNKCNNKMLFNQQLFNR